MHAIRKLFNPLKYQAIVAGQKAFWKKHEFAIVAVVTLLFVYLVVVFNQKINLLFGNEFTIHLMPYQKSFYMNYGNASEIEFDVSVSAFAYCKAACSYRLNDLSRNDTIDSGNFKLEKEQHFTKRYELSVRRLGSGQDIYSFDARCRNTRSLLCLSDSNEKFESSFVIVNYDLTDTEKELKKILRQNVTQLLNLMADVDELIQQLSQKYSELGLKVNLDNLSKQKIRISDDYAHARISIENLRSLWSAENYIKLSQLFDESIFKILENIENIKNSIAALDKGINNIAELHNSLLSQMGFLSNEMNELGAFVSVAGLLDDGNETLNNFISNADEFRKAAFSITGNTFSAYGNLIMSIENITARENLIIEKSKIPAAELAFNFEYFLKYEHNILCSLKQECNQNISSNSSNSSNISNISLNDLLKNAGDFVKSYPNAAYIRQSCNLLKGLESAYSDIRNKSLGIITGKNISFPSDNWFLLLADDFKANEARKINNSYYEAFEKIISENKTEPFIVRIADSTLPNSKVTSVPLTVPLNYSQSINQSINISLYLLSKINYSAETAPLINKCAELDKPAKANDFNFELVAYNITYNAANAASKIDTNLSDNPPVCCIFNECKPCCRDESCSNDPKTFPVIFLHGYAVVKEYSPEFSLEGFSELQLKLQDEGYLNAGTLLYSGRKAEEKKSEEKGEWGLSGKPIAVKVTYYYDIYRKEDKYEIVPAKSESINTYALRLKDIIDVVKEKTGKPKVNIVAFSMGGLVARKYIQIFGDGPVYKLITIGTPHKGVIGDVAQLCPLLGEYKECVDMQQNSLFLNKLNDPSTQPQNVQLYNIIGSGCLRDGKDGDGIILKEHASLKGISPAKEFFVNGTCSGLFNQFHTDLLEADKYPETYRMIKEILRE